MQAADKAWIALGVGVLGWDAVAPPRQMLSDASARYTKAHPLLWPAVVIFIAGHLIHVWGRNDPLTLLARAAGR